MRKWEPWTTNIPKSNNHRMFNNWIFINDRQSKLIEDLDPRSSTDNPHEYVLVHEMTTIEPTETPSRPLVWTPLTYLNHIKCRSDDDRFLTSEWETLICSSLGVTTPALLGPPQQCAYNDLSYDPFGDHLQTCQTKSASSQVHDWVVYKLGTLLGSVGHRVKIHNITPTTGKERGNLEIKDYVVIQKPQPQATRLPPHHTLIMDYTMTHIRFGRSHLYPMGQLTNTRRSDGAPDPDVAFKEVARIKIRHYLNLFCTLTVRHRLWIMNYHRNRTSFVFVLR